MPPSRIRQSQRGLELRLAGKMVRDVEMPKDLGTFENFVIMTEGTIEFTGMRGNPKMVAVVKLQDRPKMVGDVETQDGPKMVGDVEMRDNPRMLESIECTSFKFTTSNGSWRKAQPYQPGTEAANRRAASHLGSEREARRGND